MAECSLGIQEENGERGRLHAAGRRTRGAADQHEDNAEEFAAVSELRVIGRIKSGGPGRHGLKEGGEDAFLERITGVLDQEKAGGGNQDEGQCGRKDEFGLKAVLVKVPLVLDKILPGAKAQAAQNDEAHDGQIHENASGVSGQGRVGLRLPHEVKPGVAEGGYGMENGI